MLSVIVLSAGLLCYAECLSVVMLSGDMLNVLMLSVLAPLLGPIIDYKERENEFSEYGPPGPVL
jgi:hypothetical protein